MLRRLVIFLTLSTVASASDKLTYDDHAFTIFQQACLNCHNPDKAKGGLDLSTYGNTLKGGSGGKVVEAGDPGSTLIKALLPGADKPMPPEGEKLASEQVEILKGWIEGGLLENKSSSARKPSKPKFETTLRSDPASKPDGPPPMPVDLLLQPPVSTLRAPTIHAIAASPWAPLLAVTAQSQVLLFQTKSLELVGILPFPEGDPTSLTFTPDARYLIVGGGVPGKSGVTVTFDVVTGSRALIVAREFDSVLAADIRPAFDIVATGGPSRLLKIWNTETGELVRSIKKHTDWITALDLSDDGVLLASGDRNGGVWVWESDTGNEYLTLRAHQAGITATDFRSDSNILATASEDGTVRFWEMNGGSEVKKIDAHPGGVTAFAFAPDGSSITAGRDMKAKLWKSDFGQPRDLAKNIPALPTAVAIDHDGRHAFVADARGTIHVYQTSDSKAVGRLQANPPTLEDRLQKLEDEIASQQDAVAAADQHLSEMTAARDVSRHRLALSEQEFQKARDIEKAARSGGKQNPDTSSILATASDRLRKAEKATSLSRSALETVEKDEAEAALAVEKAQAALASLQASVKKWSAASINFQAITTRRQADESALNLEDSQLGFTQAAADLPPQAEALNSKRVERRILAGQFEESRLSPEAADELQATLAAIDIRIAQRAEALQQAENEIVAARQAIERSAPEVHRKRAEADQLRTAYRATLD